jgi:alpha-methylacyl-CoA racemase
MALTTGLGLGPAPTHDEVALAVASRARDEWVELFAGQDACVAPVLGLAEAPAHPHNRACGTFIEVGGVVQPGPAPRFSASSPSSPRAPRPEGEDGPAILAELGYSTVEIDKLRSKGVLR